VAFAILSKLWPAIMIFPLQFRRSTGRLGWTASFGALYCLLVLPVFGANPWNQYVSYMVPKIIDGTALEFIDVCVVNLASNFSLFGVPFKLKALGMPLDAWATARAIGIAYSMFVVGAAIFVGLRLRPDVRRQNLCLWLALLTFAALRSPLAPMHIMVGTLLLMVVVSDQFNSKRGGILFVAIWLLMTVLVPPRRCGPGDDMSFVRQLALYSFLIWVVSSIWCEKGGEQR